MLRVLLDQLVDLPLPVNGDLEDIVSKVAGLIVHLTSLRPERFAYMLRRLLSHVPLEKHLQT
jgi:hypothetical protein